MTDISWTEWNRELRRLLREFDKAFPAPGNKDMSERYERARAIAEAAANQWDKFGDTAGVQWLAQAITDAIREEAPPNDGELCDCNIGQCHFLTERCREMEPRI